MPQPGRLLAASAVGCLMTCLVPVATAASQRAGGVAAAAVAPSPAASSTAAGGCTSTTKPGQPYPDVPWHQRSFDPQRIWSLSTGAGQLVAVVDTGVDGHHPQLAGQVRPGFDAVNSGADGTLDCLSHGTAVASLIAAKPVDGTGFRGLAPGAAILPVRLGEVDPSADPASGRGADPQRLADAIGWAVSRHATVIDVSYAVTVDDPRLRSAVSAAVAANIVVVAGAGDWPAQGGHSGPATYPASYPGVIGVGAVDQTFTLADRSQTGPQVDLTAPGVAVVAAARVEGLAGWSGTAIAAALVSAAAALVRAAEPDLTAAEVASRLAATADPTPHGQRGQAYGAGIVDPYRAVTEHALAASPAAVAGVAPSPVDPAAARRQAWLADNRRSAAYLAWTVGAGAGLLCAVVAAVRLGRRRRWRPGESAR